MTESERAAIRARATDAKRFTTEKRGAEDCLALLEEVDRLRKAIDLTLWMAEKYAEGGGSGGPEMRGYNEAVALLDGKGAP